MKGTIGALGECGAACAVRRVERGVWRAACQVGCGVVSLCRWKRAWGDVPCPHDNGVDWSSEGLTPGRDWVPSHAEPHAESHADMGAEMGAETLADPSRIS